MNLKALEQAIAALRDTLPEADRKRFEENLARVTSEASTTKNLVARIKAFLQQPHWSFQTVDDQKTSEVLFTGQAIPYLSRSSLTAGEALAVLPRAIYTQTELQEKPSDSVLLSSRWWA